jgi:hypothetical protein
MRFLLVILAIMSYSTLASADSCVELARSVVSNKCSVCMEVTVRELRPRDDRSAGLFTGVSRTIRLGAGETSTLQGTQSWAVAELGKCS